MTGYGRKETGTGESRFSVEIRSLNNRYLDVQVKSPRSLAAMDPRIRKTVQERFARGRFEIFIARNGDQERTGKLSVNDALASHYIRSLREIKERYGLKGEVDLGMVANFPDIITVEEVREDVEAQWAILQEGIVHALDDLDRMRIQEGSALVKDILSRIGFIDDLISVIRTKAPASVEQARKRMTETLNRLLNEQPDPLRLAQEIAILAERTDITEELTRLGSHLQQFRAMLGDASGEAVGRKLDFLIQEIGREANTIASKAMDAAISLHVVGIKAELEKIREQVQNIE